LLSHALPLFGLIIEFSLVVTPFVMRHSIFSLFFGTTYGLVNLLTTLTHEAPYPGLAWNSPFSISMGFGLMVVLVLAHGTMVKLSRFKLSKYGVDYQSLVSNN
jgi:hypothetical protein